MPHVTIQYFPRNLTSDQQTALADDICKVLEQHLSATANSVSVALEEIPAEQWKERVYDPSIKPQLAQLAKKPGYEL